MHGEERNRPHLDAHSSEWTIVPNIKPEWQKLVHASGVYQLRAQESTEEMPTHSFGGTPARRSETFRSGRGAFDCGGGRKYLK